MESNHNYNKDEKIPFSDNSPDVNPKPPLPNVNSSGPTPDLPASAEPLSRDNKMWAMFCHLAALSTYIGIPFGNVIGPLIVWQIKKDEHPYIDEQGKAALNFQISVLIYAVISALLIFVVIGLFMLVGLGIFNLIMIIINGINDKVQDIDNPKKGQDIDNPYKITFLRHNG
ncbi:MAG: DUF4870 domain-containing protein, partial [Sedimentisphaerales bacterium]|nr:DUF4870 domain-containing protein [Sedimentisphaerales bacterium]